MSSDDRAPLTLDRTPIYAVLFEGTVDMEPYFPLVAGQYGVRAPGTIPHGLDRDVVAALPGLWYCLHLPNTLFELIDVGASSVVTAQSLDLGHQIVLAPVAAFTADFVGGRLAEGTRVLAVCPDEVLAEATARCADLGFALPPAPYSQLSSESVEAHWRTIFELVETQAPYLGPPPRLSEDLALAPTELPSRWLERRFGDVEEPGERDQDAAIHRALDAQLLLRVATQLAEGAFEPDLAAAGAEVRPPVSIAAPGVAPTYVKNAYDGELRADRAQDRSTDAADTWTTLSDGWNDAAAELSTIRFMTTHRAIARGGVGIMLPPVPGEAFGLLAQLEALMRAKPTGKSVARLLDRLADTTAHLWTPAVAGAVARASTLTAFSNFPLGLLRLPGDSAPLAARVPITYRPLLPLTRALQAELTYLPLIDRSGGVRVLVAECIPEADAVGAVSRRGWTEIQALVAERDGEEFAFDLVETLSSSALREAIDDHRPDILILSAHGKLSSNGNVAGLLIGEELSLGLGLGPLPPVVILSACHVAPRGAGTVSVADMLLREGAFAVLGTQVPVHVVRNTMLTARFLVNIAETLAGRGHYGENLLQVWRHVQSGNALLDILHGNPALHGFGMSRAPSGLPVLEEFMRIRSVDRLRTGDIYADTEAVLGAIADDMRVGDRVRNWFRNPGYVPESLFYAFTGSPERIHLRTPWS
jgi:hypothetical protein